MFLTPALERKISRLKPCIDGAIEKINHHKNFNILEILNDF